MSAADYLHSHGWKLAGHRGQLQHWDHPEHQHDRHGFFSCAEAVEHQKLADKWGCDCIRP